MSRQSPAYLRAYRLRSGRTKSVPIPVAVLAEAIANESAVQALAPVMSTPLAEHLGEVLVEAIKVVAGSNA